MDSKKLLVKYFFHDLEYYLDQSKNNKKLLFY